MSSRYNLSAGTGAPSTGASGPVGFGALKVPSASQRSCQRASISAASVALYRNGGAASASGVSASVVAAPPAVPAVVAVPASSATGLLVVMSSSPRLATDRFAAHKKSPLRNRRDRRATRSGPGLSGPSVSAAGEGAEPLPW